MNHLQQEDESLLSSSSRRRSQIIWYVWIGLFLAWNVVIFVLAVTAIAKVNDMEDDNDYSPPYVGPVTRDFVVADRQFIGPEKIVSLLPNGRLRVGAGISVYNPVCQAPRTMPTFHAAATDFHLITFSPPDIEYGFIPLLSSELSLVVYNYEQKVYGILGHVSINNCSEWGSPVAIESVPAAEAVIALRPDTGPNSSPSFLVAGQGKMSVGVVTHAFLNFTMSPAVTYNGATSGAHTKLARLSTSATSGDTFGLAYYSMSVIDGGHKMEANMGTVTYNENTPTITVYPNPLPYGVTNRALHTISVLAANSFFIAYAATNFTVVNTTTPDALVVRRATWTQQVGFLSPEQVIAGYKPNYYMTSVAMPALQNVQPRGVIVFVDESRNNAMLAVTVTAPILLGGRALAVGSVLRVTSDAAGPSFETVGGNIVPFISVSPVDGVNLVVAYSDYVTSGQITATVLRLTPDTLVLQSASPQFRLSGHIPSGSKYNYWVRVAPVETNNRYGCAVTWFLQNSGGARIAIVEVAPPPLGITAWNNGRTALPGTFMPVVMQGVFTYTVNGVPERVFQPGQLVYGSGRDGGVPIVSEPASPPPSDYVSSNGTLTTFQNRIGVALSENELLLFPPPVPQ